MLDKIADLLNPITKVRANSQLLNLTDLDPIRPPGGDEPITGIGPIVNAILGFVYPLGGVLLLFMLIWAGYDMLNARASAEKVSAAKQKITYALIGFIILILSYLIVKLIAGILGLSDQI